PGTDAVEQGLPDGRAAGSRALWRINDLRARSGRWPPGGSLSARASRGASPPGGRASGAQRARSAPQAALSASVVKLSPQPQAAAALGLANTNSWFSPLRTKSIVVPSTIARLAAST